MQTSLQLGSKLLKGFGVMSDDVDFLSQLVRNSMEIQAQDAVSNIEEQDYNIMQPVQVTKHLNSTALLLPILQVHYNIYFS